MPIAGFQGLLVQVGSILYDIILCYLYILLYILCHIMYTLAIYILFQYTHIPMGLQHGPRRRLRQGLQELWEGGHEAAHRVLLLSGALAGERGLQAARVLLAASLHLHTERILRLSSSFELFGALSRVNLSTSRCPMKPRSTQEAVA